MGSADMMPRNLNRRVEVIFPVEEDEHIRYIRDQVLETYISDNVKAREMLPDGTYQFIKKDLNGVSVNSQQAFINYRIKS